MRARRALACLLALAASPAPAAGRYAPAEVATVSFAGAELGPTWGPGRYGLGSKLRSGDSLKCGAKGMTGLALSDGSRLRLLPGVELKLNAEEADEGGSVFLQLFKGLLQGSTPALKENGRLTIETSCATLSTKGALWQALSDGQISELWVLEGIAEFAAAGKRVQLRAGEMATASHCGAPKLRAMTQLEVEAMRRAFKDKIFGKAP